MSPLGAVSPRSPGYEVCGLVEFRIHSRAQVSTILCTQPHTQWCTIAEYDALADAHQKALLGQRCALGWGHQRKLVGCVLHPMHQGGSRRCIEALTGLMGVLGLLVLMS